MATTQADPGSWPFRVGLLAAIWSLSYAVLGLAWTMRADGYPFGRSADPEWMLSVLGRVPAVVGAPVTAALGLAGTVAGVTMAMGAGRGIVRTILTGYAWVMAIGLALVVPDYRVLVIVAYTPILLFGLLPGGPSAALLIEALSWPLINQVLFMVGGVAWGGTAVAYRRSTMGACSSCGRPGSIWTSRESAATWGRWAVGVAVLVPVLYAATRLAWALGFPLGISREFLEEGQDTGLWGRGAALAASGLVGAVLSLGLIRPWGERFPRWMPVVGGRRVPMLLALVPATIVSVLVTSAGLMFLRLTVFGEAFTLGEDRLVLDEDWAALAPELLWPVWGGGLGAAALAYYYRRRGICSQCGRGSISPIP